MRSELLPTETGWQKTVSGESALAGLLASILLIIFTYSVALVPIRADNDCWWHVKSGMYISAHGLPEKDIFSYTAADHEWHNHEWLAQLAMWQIYDAGESTRLGGWRAVILAVATIIAACYLILFLLARRIGVNWWIALLVAVLAVDASRRTFFPRPPVISNFFLALQLSLLIGAAWGWWKKWWLLALPPLFALWTNLHGGWMAGLVVLICFASQDIVRVSLNAFIRRRPSARLEMIISRINPPIGIDLRFWAVLLPLCLLATLCNPYGIELYKLPVRVMSDKHLVSAIGELMPPVWKFFPNLIATLVLLAIAAIVLLLMSARKKWANVFLPLPPAEWVLFLFFLHQGVNHVRHLLLFGVMLVPVAARLFGELAGLLSAASPNRRRQVSVAAFCLAIIFAAAVLRNWPERPSYLARNQQFAATPEGYILANYPSDVVDFVELVEFTGRMYNENHYGGYLIWRLSPEKHKVFSDSRFDIFGGEIWRQEVIVIAAYEPPEDDDFPSWREVLDHWDVNWLLIKAETKLSDRLSHGDAGWAIVGDWTRLQGGRTWQVWVRDSRENEELITRARRIFQRMTKVSLP